MSATLDKNTRVESRIGQGARGDVGESLDLIFGFKLNENLMIGFSNDFTTSSWEAIPMAALRSYCNMIWEKKKIEW